MSFGSGAGRTVKRRKTYYRGSLSVCRDEFTEKTGTYIDWPE
jgi:hypothetical protein